MVIAVQRVRVKAYFTAIFYCLVRERHLDMMT